YTCPDPECPFLYVWNGVHFLEDNVILTGSEDEYNDKFSLMDYYILSQNMKNIYGKYKLEIREFENEVSQIDHLNLFSIDYPINQNIGVTPEGKVWIYSDPITPTSCVDQDGKDHLVEIMTKDGKYVKFNRPGYLIVNFGKMSIPGSLKPSDQMGSGGGTGLDPPPKDPDIERLAPKPGLNTNIVHVDVIGENGEWKNVAKIYPRTRSVLTLVELSQYINPNEDFKIKISWDQAYSADHIAYYRFDDANLTITELELTSATHSEKGAINTLLNTSDNQRVELSPDQTIKLSFSTLPEDTSKQRGFLFVAKGYYEKLVTPSDQPQDMARTHTPTMSQNYPNPFNLSTEIRFTIPNAAKVTLNIYNILGQKVATLVNEEKEAGTHTIFWDGRGKSGVEVASGIYFYQLKAGDFKELKKMLLIK
ncbi:MAG: FlgD immunoglobulin-like domain containing protein, partial [Candidatus Zixiibacteriota bacterium]